MQSTPRQLQALVDDLRQLVYELAKVEEYEPTWKTALMPDVIPEPHPEQTRADACLVVVQQMLTMQPGDALRIEWHDPVDYDDRRIATVTISPADPGEHWQVPCSA